MEYKRIIKSRKLRLKILEFLRFIPDKAMVKLQYRIKTGRKLNLKNPKRYTEKLQWYKLYYRDPLMIHCVDKYEVRKYVKKIGLGHILNKCYGVFDDPDEIDFDKLPSQFVLKDTLGGGGNSIIICKDKSNADLNAYVSQMREWVNTKNIPNGGREWVYYCGKKHRIICEKYIESNEPGGLIDYKFFCFNGKCEYAYVITNRKHGIEAEFGIYNMNYELLPYYRTDELKPIHLTHKPKQFEEMIMVSKKLSSRFPHVRVDLFCNNGNIIFGELTFFDGSGYMTFEPDSFDYNMGKAFKLPTQRKNK